ncbi:MAG: DNA cytosine methyltransferase [Pedobacter sp.]|nr:MAG: DNA cytosine methyltransferase [Pedobacter sp.]
MIRKPTYIDLFSGCGGLSLGLRNAGWEGLFAIESASDAFETLNFNLIEKGHFRWPRWLPKSAHNITDLILQYENNLTKLRGKVDMVVGSPPCQGFSIAGKRHQNDDRNGLIIDFVKVVSLIKPRIVLFENVKGFSFPFDKHATNSISITDYLKASLQDLGYDLNTEIVDMSQFGIPQRRTRYILIGVRKSDRDSVKDFFDSLRANVKSFLIKKKLPVRPTLSDAISDLVKSNGTKKSPEGQTLVVGAYGSKPSKYQAYLRKGVRVKYPNSHRFSNNKQATIDKYRYIIDNAAVNKRITSAARLKYNIRKQTIIPLSSDLPAPTLTTQPADYLHYCEPRYLTVREFARLQTFPDIFHFKGVYTIGKKTDANSTSRYAQVANAIPPLFSEQLGLQLKQLLFRT